MTPEELESLTEGVGRRVRAIRKLAGGLTQEQLARRAHVSVSLVRQVEQGRMPASPAFIASVAGALDVAPAVLMGQPPDVETPAGYEAGSVIGPLRRELAAYRVAPEVEFVPDLDSLARSVERLSALRHSAELTLLGAELPGVLESLRAAAHRSSGGADRDRSYGLLAEAYYAADQVASKLGYPDLAAVAVDRYEWAAGRSGDELAVSVGDYRRAGELIGAADWSSAERLLQASRDSIEPRVSADDDPAAVAVWGNLHLKSGLAAARAGDPDRADEHLAEAQTAAARIGEGRDDYRLAFGPTNVDIWRVGLAVEAVDGAAAMSRAATVDLPAETPAERAGHHWIDTARGCLLHGDRERTFEALLRARRVSPQQTRNHPQVHETVRVLAENDRRRTDSLAGYARWAGVAV